MDCIKIKRIISNRNYRKYIRNLEGLTYVQLIIIQNYLIKKWKVSKNVWTIKRIRVSVSQKLISSSLNLTPLFYLFFNQFRFNNFHHNSQATLLPFFLLNFSIFVNILQPYHNFPFEINTQPLPTTNSPKSNKKTRTF